MKTFKALIYLVMLTVVTIANAETKALKKAFLAKAVIIDFENVKEGHLLSVIDNDGNVIYSETLSVNGNFEKMYNFDALMNGKYTLELEKDFEIQVRPFQIKDNAILFDNSEEYTYFKPYISTDKNLLKISQLNLNSQPITIKIFYEDELIYIENIKNQNMIKRAFRLSSKLYGDYRAEISNEKQTFVQNFEI